MRVFLDANILFSASFRTSRIRDFLNELCVVAEIVTSEHAVEEARRNVSLKIQPNTHTLETFLHGIKIFTIDVFEINIDLAQKDIPILCGAIASNSNYLLTGDKKDFGKFFGKTIHGVKVVSVEIFIETLIGLALLVENKS